MSWSTAWPAVGVETVTTTVQWWSDEQRRHPTTTGNELADLRLLKAVLHKLLTEVGGQIKLGELEVDVTKENGVVIDNDCGLLTVVAIPDYVALDDKKEGTAIYYPDTVGGHAIDDRFTLSIPSKGTK